LKKKKEMVMLELMMKEEREIELGGKGWPLEPGVTANQGSTGGERQSRRLVEASAKEREERKCERGREIREK